MARRRRLLAARRAVRGAFRPRPPGLLTGAPAAPGGFWQRVLPASLARSRLFWQVVFALALLGLLVQLRVGPALHAGAGRPRAAPLGGTPAADGQLADRLVAWLTTPSDLGGRGRAAVAAARAARDEGAGIPSALARGLAAALETPAAPTSAAGTVGPPPALALPVEDTAVLTVFSPDRPGVDLAGPEGAPVRAAAAGVVARIDYSEARRHVVEVAHAGGLVTVYARLDRVGVEPGARVRRGDVLGTLAGADPDSDRAYLHFQVWHRGRPVDPAEYLPGLDPGG